MITEIQVTIQFLLTYLYNKLPRRRVDLLAEELQRRLIHKFDGHWYPGKPFKGSGYRCIRSGTDTIDPVISESARACGVDQADIIANTPNDLTIWIDPEEVSYRIGEKGTMKMLYNGEESHEKLELEQVFYPIMDSAATSPLGDVSPDETMFAAGNNGARKHITFTTEAFINTKFGSTKMRNGGKKVNTARMSPTQFTVYMKQRTAQMHNQKRSLSPHAREFTMPEMAANGLYMPEQTSKPNNLYIPEQNNNGQKPTNYLFAKQDYDVHHDFVGKSQTPLPDQSWEGWTSDMFHPVVAAN